MSRSVLTLALLAAICASAIGIANADDKAPPDQPARYMSAADTSKWLAFFDKLVATVAGSTGTCAKMATDVNAVIDANQDAIAVARVAHTTNRKLPQAAQEHMMAGVKKMVPGLNRCNQDDKVRAAFARIDLTRDEPAARR